VSMNTVEHARDVVVIGSGPAGLTAAIYAARANLNPLVIEGSAPNLPGGQLMITSEVENFPGFAQGIQGPELMEQMREQAVRVGAEFLTENVTEVNLENRPFKIETSGGLTVYAKTAIITTGASAKWLGIPSETALYGKGVSACATCDGFFYRDKNIMVAGGGDSAMEEANFLTRFGRQVTLVHRRDEFRASKIMIDRARHNPKIRFLTNTVVEDIYDPSEKLVTGARLRNVLSGETWDEPVDGFFVAIGHTPNTRVFHGQIDTDPDGYILSKGGARTNIPGVFHAGDVQDRVYR